MGKAITPIGPGEWGTADYVSEETFVREVEWGGFVALLRGRPDDGPECTGSIFLRAKAWTGAQPRLVLNRGDAGYRDWLKLLEAAPPTRVMHRFVGAARAARGDAQWLTHGPSPLL